MNKLIIPLVLVMAIFPVVAQAQVYVTWWEATPFWNDADALIAAVNYANSDIDDKILFQIIRQDVSRGRCVALPKGTSCILLATPRSNIATVSIVGRAGTYYTLGDALHRK